MKLLIVEDEVKIALTLKKGLEEQGYQIDLACDGFEGYAACLLHRLVIPVALVTVVVPPVQARSLTT
jgi:DNA-binding response OmpR family regulator